MQATFCISYPDKHVSVHLGDVCYQLIVLFETIYMTVNKLHLVRMSEIQNDKRQNSHVTSRQKNPSSNKNCYMQV